MRPVTLKVPYSDGTIRAVNGWLVAPGLVVHEEHAKWVIIHHRSGATIAVYPDPESAAAVAVKRLAPLTDWTVDGPTIKAKWFTDAAFRASVRAVITNGMRYPHYVAEAENLNDVGGGGA